MRCRLRNPNGIMDDKEISVLHGKKKGERSVLIKSMEVPCWTTVCVLYNFPCEVHPVFCIIVVQLL